MKGSTWWGSEGVLKGVQVAQHIWGGGAGVGATLLVAVLCFVARVHQCGDGTLQQVLSLGEQGKELA